jgi:Tfp pilus assembly protein PilF
MPRTSNWDRYLFLVLVVAGLAYMGSKGLLSEAWNRYRVQVHMDRAVSAVQNGKRLQARAEAAKVLSLDPSPRQRADVGYLLLHVGETDKGREAMNRAVDEAPDDPEVLNGVGYSLADAGLELERALQLVEKANQLQPDNAAIMDSVGWANYKLGNLTEARRWIEQAHNKDPRNPEITDHFIIVRAATENGWSHRTRGGS